MKKIMRRNPIHLSLLLANKPQGPHVKSAKAARQQEKIKLTKELRRGQDNAICFN